MKDVEGRSDRIGDGLFGEASSDVKGPFGTWRGVLGWVVAITLFAVGLVSVPLAIYGPDRALIPGDRGDARFNNYILEHGHRWMTGQEDSFWDAPFMYPWKNTVAFSDSHLGTMPFYAAMRSMGLSREGAFQGWLLLMFALNYWLCLLALRRWAGHLALAACAAFIFAFGIFNIGQINNLQMMPRFMAPLAFLFFWRHLQTGSGRMLAWAALAVIYQLYCGLYMGLILLYGLFFLAVGHVVVYRKPSFLARFRAWRFAGLWLVTATAGALLLLPLLLPHLQVPPDVGHRDFEAVATSIPRPSSYFFTHPAAMSWRSLSHHGVDAFPEWWHHFHFLGITPWLALLAAPFLLGSKRMPTEQRRLIAAIGIGLVLSVLFSLNIGGFTLYALVFKLPGFGVLRAVDRFINMEVLFFLILFVLVVRPLFRKPWAALLLSLALPVLVVQDNRWEVGWLRRFDKLESRRSVADAARRIQREYGGPERWDAVAYEPPLGWKAGFEDRHSGVIFAHLDAMLAGQELGIPVVNAYTGGYPGNYMSFFDNMDHQTLSDWCAFNGIGADRVQEIHGLALPVVHMDRVVIRAMNGKFLSIDPDKEGVAMADRDIPSQWETFIRVRVPDGRTAYLAHTGNYLFAELEGDGHLVANGGDVGDHGLFEEEGLVESGTALKAFNGRYWALEPNTGQVKATAETPDGDGFFSVEVTGGAR